MASLSPWSRLSGTEMRVVSQMEPYSLFSALLSIRAHRGSGKKVLLYIRNREAFGMYLRSHV